MARPFSDNKPPSLMFVTQITGLDIYVQFIMRPRQNKDHGHCSKFKNLRP